MCKTFYVILATICGVGVGSALPAAAQSYPDAPAASPACQPVTGHAQINGAEQQISGWACQQPDGTWQIMQTDEAGNLYPVAGYPYPYYYYDGPWFWGAPVVLGVGASFVFVDRFHRFHPMNRGHFGHGRGGWSSAAGWHGGAGGARGFGGGMMRR
ncbi:hypothetical protein [Trinickia acidisoli]|uniref:hypothetical protein n=1 Tax=Trinickia acidisoli TaxID=2767482 RepID=UPI001A903A44|nr:hypothetical protein [Trinickia acidisoli]